MSGRLVGQVAIVTGGGRGRAIALRLAAGGAAIGVISRSTEQLADVVSKIEAGAGRADLDARYQPLTG